MQAHGLTVGLFNAIVKTVWCNLKARAVNSFLQEPKVPLTLLHDFYPLHEYALLFTSFGSAWHRSSRDVQYVCIVLMLPTRKEKEITWTLWQIGRPDGRSPRTAERTDGTDRTGQDRTGSDSSDRNRNGSRIRDRTRDRSGQETGYRNRTGTGQITKTREQGVQGTTENQEIQGITEFTERTQRNKRETGETGGTKGNREKHRIHS